MFRWEELPFVRTLFSLFEEVAAESYAEHLLQVVGGKGYDREHTQVKLTFLRRGYVLEGLILYKTIFTMKDVFLKIQNCSRRRGKENLRRTTPNHSRTSVMVLF